jgi:hypothetical protein
MRSEIPSVNVASAAATVKAGGVVADSARDDHAWMVCQGNGGANSEPVLDSDIKVGGFGSLSMVVVGLALTLSTTKPHSNFRTMLQNSPLVQRARCNNFAVFRRQRHIRLRSGVASANPCTAKQHQRSSQQVQASAQMLNFASSHACSIKMQIHFLCCGVCSSR